MEYFSSDNLIEYNKKVKREGYSNVVFCVVIVALLLILLYYKTFVFMVVSVKGNSMTDTLHNGDLLVADKTVSCRRGDIVVFYDDDINDEPLIKRVIAVEGDTVWSDAGFVYISYIDDNGKNVTERLDEPYVYKSGVTNVPRTVISDGMIFVLGDNRSVSSDSRYFGAVKNSAVLGVVPDWSIKIKDLTIVSWYKSAIGA